MANEKNVEFQFCDSIKRFEMNIIGLSTNNTCIHDLSIYFMGLSFKFPVTIKKIVNEWIVHGLPKCD